MATLTIRLDMDNAAFEDGGPEEVKSILTNLCDRLPDPLNSPTHPGGEFTLHDSNGNYCGAAFIE